MARQSIISAWLKLSVRDRGKQLDTEDAERPRLEMTVPVDFNAAASLRKWPSINGQRNSEARHPATYLVFAETLAECIRQFLSKAASQRHLYEIHTKAQPPSWWRYWIQVSSAN